MLIVDDDRALLATLVEIVEALGHEVHATSSTAAALEIARATAPDVALIDFNISGDLSGRGLLQRLCALDPNTRVVVFSGSVEPEVEREVRALGASEYLKKPVGLAVLREVLARAAGEAGESP